MLKRRVIFIDYSPFYFFDICYEICKIHTLHNIFTHNYLWNIFIDQYFKYWKFK